MVRMSGNWSAKIPGSRNFSWRRPQSAIAAIHPSRARLAA